MQLRGPRSLQLNLRQLSNGPTKLHLNFCCHRPLTPLPTKTVHAQHIIHFKRSSKHFFVEDSLSDIFLFGIVKYLSFMDTGFCENIMKRRLRNCAAVTDHCVTGTSVEFEQGVAQKKSEALLPCQFNWGLLSVRGVPAGTLGGTKSYTGLDRVATG